ncbi:hypothetical protein [Azospirillum humicireducens]|uniref:hypothetical protein n=1 Tax=Azospirillum humicireducens TaxID=1226968 RepID=UPI0011B1CAC2|nr:hypothetical protein [Azospirillum humicireducens]
MPAVRQVFQIFNTTRENIPYLSTACRFKPALSAFMGQDGLPFCYIFPSYYATVSAMALDGRCRAGVYFAALRKGGDSTIVV